MTQAPHGGQTAPRSTGFGSVAAPRHSPQNADPNESPWGSTSTSAPGEGMTFGAPAHADAPTASVPYVPSNAQRPGDPGATSGPGATGSNRSSRTARARGPRRARLQLRHINPWTVLKFSCVLSIALFFVWLIIVGVLFGILDGAGIIQKINDAVTTINGPGSKPPVTATLVFGGAAIIGVVNIVLFIALSTVGSVVYNLCADLVGGIEITLSER
jgi:hypothetical protein